MVVVVVVLVGPCSFPFPFGSAGLGIGDRHPSPRESTARPPTSFQTFHFAEGHEPPKNESHGKTEEGRRDSDNTVMQQPSFETQTLLNVHLINVPQRAHHSFLTFLRVPFLFLIHTIPDVRFDDDSSCFSSPSHYSELQNERRFGIDFVIENTES